MPQDNSHTRHILVINRDGALRDFPVSGGIKEGTGVVADVVANISDAVSALGRAGYDAVLLRVDNPQEMSLILRIKASAPRTALLAFVPEEHDELETLARENGADAVVRMAEAASDGSVEARRPLHWTDNLIERSRLVMRQTRALREYMMELLARSRVVRAKDFDLARIPVQDFRPLLIEDDPDQAKFLARACRKAGLPLPLPVMRNGEDAIRYLRGDDEFSDRSKFPLPTLVVSDLHLPKMSGLDVLRWMRSQPSLAGLVFFVLSCSPLREDFDLASALGADYYLVKPVSLASLGDVVKVMAMRWALIEEAWGLRRER